MKGFQLDLTSTRLAFVLIALLVLMILISAILPQEEPTAGRIRNSPYFLATLGLLAVNLAAGNVKRIRAIRRIRKAALLAGHLGSVVFHLALLMIILAVMLNSLFRFTGVFGLTEGQTLRDVPQDYFRVFAGSLSGDERGRFSITLDQVDREFPVGDAVTDAAMIRVGSADDELAVQGAAHINHPLRRGNMEFHLGSTVGYSPEVVVKLQDGSELFRSFIRLKSRFDGDNRYGEDYIRIPGEDLEIRVRVEADSEPGQAPSCRLDVRQGESSLFEGDVSLEETVAAGDYTVTVPRLRNWCYIHAVTNPWLSWVFAGFWICLAGLAIRAFAQMIGDRRSMG